MKYEISDYDAKIERVLYIVTIMLAVMNLYYYGIDFMDKQNYLVMAAVILIMSNSYRIHKKSDKLDSKGRMKDKDFAYLLIYVVALVVLLGVKMIQRRPESVVVIIVCFCLFGVFEILCWVSHKKHSEKKKKAN